MMFSIATVTKGKVTENFIWDGLALVKRGAVSYLNEPHLGGGAPVASSDGGVMFNDILGTTLGVSTNDGYASSSMTAFGDTANCQLPTSSFFTGKPHVDGLGHAFLLRNYRADLGKWPTADPLSYPDGWNQLAYCRNGVVDSFDFLGGVIKSVNLITRWANIEGNGVGTPFLSVYKYMKDTWNAGSLILSVLNIDNVKDLIDKINEELTNDIKQKIEDIIGTNRWFEEAVKAAIAEGSLPLGFDVIEPSKAQIDAAVGRSDYTIISKEYQGVISCDVDNDTYGVYFINGCDQKWKVIVEY